MHSTRSVLAAHLTLASPMPVPPSFSSFPPSFSSFPDLGDSSRKGLESAASSTPPVQRRDSKDKQSDRKKRKRDRRDRGSNLGQIPSSKRRSRSQDSQDHGQVLHDDERIKAEEDSARRAGQRDDSQLVFFSDKKGDPLNAQYGGIYSRDIPKYHLAGCESCWRDFTTTNNAEAGRKVLGLTSAWTTLRRSNRIVEVVVGGRQKVCTWRFLYTGLCRAAISF